MDRLTRSLFSVHLAAVFPGAFCLTPLLPMCFDGDSGPFLMTVYFTALFPLWSFQRERSVSPPSFTTVPLWRMWTAPVGRERLLSSPDTRPHFPSDTTEFPPSLMIPHWLPNKHRQKKQETVRYLIFFKPIRCQKGEQCCMASQSGPCVPQGLTAIA